ncbi:transglycosylase domain-containing protein [Lacticaseibacillus pabuli]|uniref:Transglycosylase domain-containing protein n=1 Tax=Lacticaseibacillus pabuli TaxID=3025672 RepID=A0ABY7WTC6_9LACO|nr:transglycosylase domain-containing protein [Lacticaseibacillus sp. KACC 23028]WDF83417.1 transglycosylase domain-containing protein [Lacticaseibacillus sp. KACC 23028]
MHKQNKESNHHGGEHRATVYARDAALPPFSRETAWLYVDTGLQVFRKLIISAFVGLVVLGALGFGLGLGYFASIVDKTSIPTPTSLRHSVNNAATSATLYYANNVELADVKSDLVRKTVPLDQMSPWVQKAIVATEDQDFFTHHGVMPKSLLRAVLSSVTGVGSQTGGSTLTQQLVKMQLLSSETTFKRKAQEIMLALRVDKYMSKQDVLAAYLNTATLGRNNKGQNIAGVQAAAQGIFGVDARDLNLAQAAFIAGLPQSPFGYTPYTTSGAFNKELTPGLERQKTVLFRMYRAGYITDKEYADAKSYDLKAHFLRQEHVSAQRTSTNYAYNAVFGQAQTIIAEQLARRDDISVKEMKSDPNLYNQYLGNAATMLKSKGYRVHSTLIKPVYNKMQETLSQYRNTFGQSHTYSYVDPNTGQTSTTTEPPENGTVLLNNRTGAILGFVGGVKPSVNHIFTQRSPGSTIKPLLVYGPAIDKKIIGSNTMLADFKTNFNKYKVTDYGGKIQNRFIPASEALAWSYNIPAINLYNTVRKQVHVKSYMEKMGINTLTANDYSQLGLGLGGTDYGVTLAAQASAFSTFANQGDHVPSYMIDKITDPNGHNIYKHHVKKRKVFSKATSYIMSKMLSGVVADGTAASIGGSLNFNTKNLIGKTGTSNDYRDIWFIGSTPGVTMASWLGYDNNYGQTFNMSSSGSAINQQYWAAQMNAIYKLIPSKMRLGDKMKKPSTVKSVVVNAQTGYPNGTVTANGSTITTSGSTLTSLYNDWTPGRLPNRFAIGGTSANYTLFWNHILGISNGYGQVTDGSGVTDDQLQQAAESQAQQSTTNSDTTGADTYQQPSSSSSSTTQSSVYSSSSIISTPAVTSSSATTPATGANGTTDETTTEGTEQR